MRRSGNMDGKGQGETMLRRTNRKRVKSQHGKYSEMFQCEECDKAFTTKGVLNIHARSHRKSEQSRKRLVNKHTQTPEKALKALPENFQKCVGLSKKETDGCEDSEDPDYQSPKTKSSKSKKIRGRSVCEVCNKSFVNSQVLTAHMRTHTGERPYVCTLCEKSFTQMSSLKDHMNIHSNERFKCDECDAVFTQLRSLNKHSKYHTGELEMKRPYPPTWQKYREYVHDGVTEGESPKEIFRCDFCRKEFKTGGQLLTHRRIHTNERPFECRTCGRSFKQKITLLDHEATHLDHKPHKCDACGSMFKQKRTLKHHQKSKACAKRTRLGAHQQVERIREGKNAETSNDFEAEKSMSETENTLDASDSSHQSDNDGVGTSAAVDEKPGVREEKNAALAKAGYVCELCGKMYRGKKNLSQHLKTHREDRPFVCKVCDKSFKIKGILVEHMAIHNEGRPHTCQTCGKQFKTQKCLQNHIGRNICTGFRPYVCNVCNKAFMYARYLEKHRCPRGERKAFPCDKCSKTFTRHNVLREHMRVHTGERPLECETCGKTFAKRDLLRRHRLTHKTRQFSCQECGKLFAMKSGLQAHLATHTEERNFVCEICNKAFKQANTLRNHHKTMHSTTDSLLNTKPSAYLCSNCGRMFRHLRWLLKHFCEAKGQKRFNCEICHKSFDTRQRLKVHSRTHSGDRPFECPECKKSFTQSGSLKDHMVTHTGEKMHKCDQCDSSFTRKNSLHRHRLIIHQGVEPFICSKCSLTFKYKKSYDAHMDTCSAPEENPPLTAPVPAPASEDFYEGKVVDILPEVSEVVQAPDLEQQVLDSILGNIERAMNGAGINIRDNIQYQIVVGDASGEVTLHVEDSQQGNLS